MMQATSPVGIEPEMVAILQHLAHKLVESRAEVSRCQAMFDSYIRHCARAMGFDPDNIVFDAPSASFIPKTHVRSATGTD